MYFWVSFNPFVTLLGGARFTPLKFTNKDHSSVYLPHGTPFL